VRLRGVRQALPRGSGNGERPSLRIVGVRDPGEIPLPPCRGEAGEQRLSQATVSLRLGEVRGVSAGARPAGKVTTAVVRGKELFLPLENVIDVAAERARLEKELAKAQKERDFLVNRLANQGFVANAPPALLDETRAKLALAEEAVANLEKALAALG